MGYAWREGSYFSDITESDHYRNQTLLYSGKIGGGGGDGGGGEGRGSVGRGVWGGGL